MIDAANIVDGRRQKSRGGYDVQNPATLEVVATAPQSSAADLDEAVAAAQRARSGWASDLDARRAALDALAGVIEANITELARLLTLEQGKPLMFAEGEFRNAIRILRHYAQWREPQAILRDTAENVVRVVRAPLGVVGLIVPWNVPITILHMKLGPALIAGNTLVVKPAPTTPLATLRYLELAAAVLPPGVINTVTGGGDVGAALVEHRGVRKISFTGSTPTGRLVMRGAADTLKRLTLELGGNDAAILLDDIDPAVVAPRVFMSAFANAGQICVAIKRLYVHDKHYSEMAERLRALADQVVVGDGAEQGVQMGPVNNRPQYDIVRELLDDAGARGSEVFGGGGVEGLPGHFIRPAIVTNIPRDARLVREEQFGPALPIIAFSDEADAIAEANSVDVGLGGSVWSGDVERAAALAARLEAGNLYVNHHAIPPDPEIPFGGVKQSGFGHELGAWGVDDASDRKVLSVLR